MKFTFTLIISLSFLFISGCTSDANLSSVKSLTSNKGDIRCYKEYTSLMKLNPKAFSIYKEQFEKINKSNNILIKNKSSISRGASEVLASELNDKLSLVCFRIKTSVFNNMLSRANAMDDI